jgi:uncharacterized protein
MLTVISPSKGQDFDQPLPDCGYTQPALQQHSQELITILRTLTPENISDLMDVSSNIANLNYQRFQEFSNTFTPENSRPALFAFKGDVYRGFALNNYQQADFDYAQRHIRILSGLYGYLHPLDLIQPYRLEMKTRLNNNRGANLYQFWGNQVTDCLNQELEQHDIPVLINLASGEYFKVVKPKQLIGTLITVHFKEVRNGTPRIIGTYAKAARGKMANFIVQNRINTPEALLDFHEDHYAFNPDLSSDSEFIFTR